MQQQHNTRGFTLLEVMIALVIFSIGLMGLAGLQAIALQNNQVAYSRTVATILAYDLADRIRNNRGANYAVAIPSTAPATCTGGTTTYCAPAAMVQRDLWEWNQSLQLPQNNLLSAAGFITPNGTGFTISIGWDENRQGLTPTNCNPKTPANIECVSIRVEP